MKIHTFEFCEETIPRDKLHFAPFLMALNQGKNVEYIFTNKDRMSLRMTDGEFAGLGYIKYLEVTFGEYSPGYTEDGKDAWLASESQYFKPENIQAAAMCFTKRIQSEKPSNFYWEEDREGLEGDKLENIRIAETGELKFSQSYGNGQRHYDYLGAILDAFWVQVFGKTLDQMYCAGITASHGDKGYRYKDEWEKKGIPFHQAMAVFLLTWTPEFGETPKHNSSQWVIENFQKYLPKIIEAEKITAREKYGYKGN